MNKLAEYIFILSVCFLQVSSFLGGNSIFSGDNLILGLGITAIIYFKFFRISKLSIPARKLLLAGFILIFLIPFYKFIKDEYILQLNTGYEFSTFKTLVRFGLVYFFVKYLNINKTKYQRGLNSILIFGILITLSMLFETLFLNMGFNLISIGGTEEEEARYAGFTGLNVNVLGGLLCVLLGLAMSLFNNKQIKLQHLIIYASFITVGIFLTGSRNAALTLALLFVFFQFDNFKIISIKYQLPKILLIILVFYFIKTYGSTTINRFETYSNDEFLGLGTRLFYWELYMNAILKNPVSLLIGSLDLPPYHRSAHNYYIETTFYTGLILISYALVLIVKAIKQSNKMKSIFKYNSINYKYILIPILIMWFTNASVIPWYGIIALASVGIFIKKREINIDYQ